jgi:hypothetical protein
MQRTRHRRFVQSYASNQRPSIFPQHAGKFNQPTAPPPNRNPSGRPHPGRARLRASCRWTSINPKPSGGAAQPAVSPGWNNTPRTTREVSDPLAYFQTPLTGRFWVPADTDGSAGQHTRIILS